MTTTNVEVEVMPQPGTIIFVQGSSNMKDSLFGLTTSLDFFKENVGPRVLERFEDNSSKPEWDILIPVMVMTEDFSWTLRFCQRHHSTQFESIISKNSKISECLRWMNCFTHRDGSRYYAIFLDHLHYYLKFLSGKQKIGEFSYLARENHLERKFLEHLMMWREGQKIGQGLAGTGGVIEHPLALGLSLRDK